MNASNAPNPNIVKTMINRPSNSFVARLCECSRIFCSMENQLQQTKKGAVTAPSILLRPIDLDRTGWLRLVQRVLQRLARFEPGNARGLDRNRFARLRVATGARRALLDCKRSEADQHNWIGILQS